MIVLSRTTTSVVPLGATSSPLPGVASQPLDMLTLSMRTVEAAVLGVSCMLAVANPRNVVFSTINERPLLNLIPAAAVQSPSTSRPRSTTSSLTPR